MIMFSKEEIARRLPKTTEEELSLARQTIAALEIDLSDSRAANDVLASRLANPEGSAPVDTGLELIHSFMMNVDEVCQKWRGDPTGGTNDPVNKHTVLALITEIEAAAFGIEIDDDKALTLPRDLVKQDALHRVEIERLSKREEGLKEMVVEARKKSIEKVLYDEGAVPRRLSVLISFADLLYQLKLQGKLSNLKGEYYEVLKKYLSDHGVRFAKKDLEILMKYLWPEE
ncbi:MAG: hypothetical protein V7752_12640 [Halopseudomonas sp.]